MLFEGEFLRFDCMNVKRAMEELKNDSDDDDRLWYDETKLRLWKGDHKRRLYVRDTDDDYISIGVNPRSLTEVCSETDIETDIDRDDEFAYAHAIHDGDIIAVVKDERLWK